MNTTTDSRVIRSIPVKVGYERREPLNLSISLTDSFSLRDEIKKHLKLQVPARELTLSLKPFDTGKDNINLDQCSPRKQMSVEEEKQFLKQIQLANTHIYAVCAAFEIGDYICTGNELGSGAFSQVYRGYHKTTKQPVAIKVVDYSTLTTSKAIEYHTNERKILQSLESHENIVKLFDLLEKHEGTAKYIYFVLEYCDGGSLDNYIRKTPLKEHQARRFMQQLVNGMILLENKNIIHRDLKPQNLLLTSKNMDEAVLKICDFGFGRFYTTQDLIESFPGTPLYESPDTLLSKPYNDNASDVWAMGAIFYEMLTGKVLFSNVRTMVELKAAISQDPSKYLIFPKELEASISRDCKDLLFKLMEKDSRKRITLPNILKHPFLESSAKKMIYSAKDGLGFAIEITQPISVAELRSALASHSRIPRENILLLLDGGVELSDSKELREDYPPKGQQVFLFDKSAILPSLEVKSVPIIKEEELEIPAISVEDRPFTELIKYKYKFANVYLKQKAYLSTCQKAYKLFEESLPILSVQVKSLKALLLYFNMDTSMLDSEIKILESDLSAKNSVIQNILANFETVLLKMRSTPLFGMNNSNSKTLMDVCNERQIREDFANFKVIYEDLRKFIDNAHIVHRRILEKPDYSEIFNVYESRTSSPVQLKDTLRANVNFLQATVDTMYQNYLKVVSELDRAKKLSNNNGIRRDVTDCIEEMSKINDTHFAQAIDLEKMMNSTLIQVLNLRSRVMAGITAIFDIKKQSQLITQNITAKSLKLNDILKIAETLQKIMEMPKAHEDYLLEMQRRANFHATFAKKANLAQGVLQKMIEEESTRIKLFKLRMGEILPLKVFSEIQQDSYPATVLITVPLAPSFPANNMHDDDEGFTDLMNERKDYDQILSENKRLMDELMKALEANKEISSSLHDSNSSREDISKLKLKYEQDKAKQLEYMDEYDRRVAADKARIRELEEREKTMATKLADLQKTMEAENSQKHLEMKTMVEAQAKIAELEEKVSTLQNELKKESNVRLQSSEGMLSLQSELRKETNIRTELSRQIDEALQRADSKTQELKVLASKYETLLAKVGLTECPFCSQTYSQKDIQEHIDKKH